MNAQQLHNIMFPFVTIVCAILIGFNIHQFINKPDVLTLRTYKNTDAFIPFENACKHERRELKRYGLNPIYHINEPIQSIRPLQYRITNHRSVTCVTRVITQSYNVQIPLYTVDLPDSLKK